MWPIRFVNGIYRIRGTNTPVRKPTKEKSGPRGSCLDISLKVRNYLTSCLSNKAARKAIGNKAASTRLNGGIRKCDQVSKYPIGNSVLETMTAIVSILAQTAGSVVSLQPFLPFLPLRPLSELSVKLFEGFDRKQHRLKMPDFVFLFAEEFGTEGNDLNLFLQCMVNFFR